MAGMPWSWASALSEPFCTVCSRRLGQAALVAINKGGGHCCLLYYRTVPHTAMLSWANQTLRTEGKALLTCKPRPNLAVQAGVSRLLTQQPVTWYRVTQHRAVTVSDPPYLCHGDASRQRSNPEGPGVESRCPGCNPPGAASAKLETGT